VTAPRRIAKNGDEADVISKRWRRRLAWLQRAGATKSVKRRINRRERREGRAEIRKGEG
jgi:hypothetical protein